MQQAICLFFSQVLVSLNITDHSLFLKDHILMQVCSLIIFAFSSHLVWGRGGGGGIVFYSSIFSSCYGYFCTTLPSKVSLNASPQRYQPVVQSGNLRVNRTLVNDMSELCKQTDWFDAVSWCAKVCTFRCHT